VADVRLADDDVTEVAFKPRPSPVWREHAQTTDCKQWTVAKFDHNHAALGMIYRSAKSADTSFITKAK